MHIVFVLIFSFFSLLAPAQLYIGAGAQVQLTGNAQLTVRDMDFVNNGSFAAGNSTVYFQGSANNNIGGTQPVQFYIIQINKDAARSIVFQRLVGVSSQVDFSQGLIDLNGHNLDLGSTGMLIGESETSRIIGAAGGEVLLTTTLNSPVIANPANLGAVITTLQNLGTVVIKRGHRPQALQGGGASIARYYDIHPTNNAGLLATLRLRYFDAELNGLQENNLTKWRSLDGIAWTYQAFTTRDATQNYVEKAGIDAFSIWTIGAPAAALPVVFIDFRAQCEGGKITLRWETAQEFNSSHFVIERNPGSGWLPIGQVPAAGNSTTIKSYVFTESSPVERASYRIAQYDIDGTVKYTRVVAGSCGTMEGWQAWPNPFSQSFTIRIQSERSEPAWLRVVDAKGAVIINRQLKLQTGLNQFEVDLRQAAAGPYLLKIEWAEGRRVKTMNLLKQ